MGKNTSIQHILKSTSTSFKFSNFFSEMNIKKITNEWGRGDVREPFQFPLGSGITGIY